MKCTQCGKEVEAQRFCKYCGAPLNRMTVGPARTPSGVMRFRHRSQMSQTSLPEVRAAKQASGMRLESLKRSSGEFSDARQSRVEPTRQSRELEALLSKLNAAEEREDEDIFESAPSVSMQSMEVSLGDSAPSMPSVSSEDLWGDESLHDEFFSARASQHDMSVPVGSGSFSRVPSGGFHLVVDTIKAAGARAVRAVRGAFSGGAQSGGARVSTKTKRNAALAVVAAAVIVAGALVVSGKDEAPSAPEIASAPAATPVVDSGYDDILALEEPEQEIDSLTFDADDFSIPAFEADGTAQADSGDHAVADLPAQEAAKPAAETVAVKMPGAPTQKRHYGARDNVFLGQQPGKKIKTSRSCIMREGPASRFGLAKQIPAGASIEIVTSVEEDWVLEKGGLWKKSGMTKLGPGSQFADAAPGMSISQPKSRVISSGSWRYVKYGELYGYVGPACFK